MAGLVWNEPPTLGLNGGGGGEDVVKVTPTSDNGQGQGDSSVSSEDGGLDMNSHKLQEVLFSSDIVNDTGDCETLGVVDGGYRTDQVAGVGEGNGSKQVENETLNRPGQSEVVDGNAERGRVTSSQRKPGVILLGRGNSFSLGRSEVIVIHHPHKRSTNDNLRTTLINRLHHSTKENKRVLDVDSDNSNSISCPLSRIQEKQDSENDDLAELESCDKVDGVVTVSRIPPIPSASPPPISNGLSHSENLNNSSDVEESFNGVYREDLKDLWQKAEAIMAKRNDRVSQILEEFGIGQPGGGGGEEEIDWEEDEDVEDRKKEEEEVWRIIQQNFQV